MLIYFKIIDLISAYLMTTDPVKYNLERAKSSFSAQLNDHLSKKYGKKVPVVFFVNQFNLRAHGTNPIAYETGRKWLNGLSIPSISNMKVLMDWLDMSAECFFIPPQALQNNHLTNTIAQAHSLQTIHNINEIATKLDDEQLSFLLCTALTLQQFCKNKELGFNLKYPETFTPMQQKYQ